MILASGIYRVTVDESNNPTYLSGGVYQVTVRKPSKDKTLLRADAQFKHCKGYNASTTEPLWSHQPGTFERVRMLNIFETQGRVVCIPVTESELDAVANSIHGKDWAHLTEAQQIEACKAGL